MNRSTLLTLTLGALLGATIVAIAPALTPTASAQPGERRGMDDGFFKADGPRAERFQRLREGAGERVEELLSLIEEANPEMHARLIELRENNPDRFRRAIMRAAPRLRELAMLREHDPEAFELRRQELQISREIFQIVKRIAMAEADDLTADALQRAQDHLEVLIGEVFEIRIQLGERHIERLEERLERLRAEVADRIERKDQLIDDRAAELLRKALERGPLAPDEPLLP